MKAFNLDSITSGKTISPPELKALSLLPRKFKYKEHTNNKNIENSLNLLKKFSQSWPKHEKPEKWIVKKNTTPEKINYKFKK